jgi:hypothetical protein
VRTSKPLLKRADRLTRSIVCGADARLATRRLASGVRRIGTHHANHVLTRLFAFLAGGDAGFHQRVIGERFAFLGTALARLSARMARQVHERALPSDQLGREIAKRRAVRHHLRHPGMIQLAARSLHDAVVKRDLTRRLTMAACLIAFSHHRGMLRFFVIGIVGRRRVRRQQRQSGRARSERTN